MPSRGRSNVNIKAGIVAKMGTIMLMWRNYARNTADACRRAANGLVNAGIAGNVIDVVAASPQGAGTHSLNRYPSPYGRLCALRHRPPFFLFKTKGYGDRRGFACIVEFGMYGFDRGTGIALNGGVNQRNKGRDTAGCSSYSYFFWRFWRLLRLQPMAIRRLVRMGLLQPARLVLPPIARAIPTAATDVTRPIGVFPTNFRPSLAIPYIGPGALPCAGSCC